MSSVKTNDGKTVSNLERFQNLVYCEDIDIVFVNETWLSKSAYNTEILHAGYTLIRKDREGRGGGVLLGIKSGLFKSVREIKHNYNLEIALVELTTMSDMNVLVGSCYRPRNADKTWIENFDNLLNDVCTRHSKIVLAGDFNFPRACWNSNENSTSINEKSFIKILDDYFLEQLNKFLTRENNILDLVITSIPDKIIINELLKPSDSKILTDHSAILFELTAACSPLQKVNRFVFDYQRANFDGLRAHLQSRNLKVKISDNGDINYDWMNWKNAFLAAVAEFVPVINTKGRKFLPWMNSTILHHIKKN